MFIPFFITKLYLPKPKVIPEYRRLEDSFEESGDQLIITAFGEKQYDKLYVDDLNWVPICGIDLCKHLLSKNETKNNDDLRFYIYAKTARLYFKDGLYKEAIEFLGKALSIKPNDFVTNFRIAQLLERIGSGKEAIVHYEQALKAPDITSKKLQRFFSSQIRRVKRSGPRQKEPPRGLKWLS